MIHWAWMNDMMDPLPTETALVPITHFDTMQGFLDEMAQTGGDPLAPDPTYLYRGLPERYFRAYPPRPQPGMAKNCCFMDSFLPSDARGLDEWMRQSPHSPTWPLRYSNQTTWLRAYVTVFVMLGQATALNDPAVLNWLNGLIVQGVAGRDRALAIGEHSGFFPTAYLNLTSDFRVALWFATHGFLSGTYNSWLTEVLIYRINRQALVDVLGSNNVVDIRDVPPQLAVRPSLQRGFVAVGAEQHEWLPELIEAGGVTALVFPPEANYGHYLGVNDIRPPEPIMNLFQNVMTNRWAAIDPASWQGIMPPSGQITHGDMTYWEPAFTWA